MGEDQGQERAPELTGDQGKSAAQLRAEIEDVREELGETTAALAAKTDIKARAREKAEELKHAASAKLPHQASAGGANAAGGLAQLREKARQNPVPTAAAGALIGGFLLGRLTAR